MTETDRVRLVPKKKVRRFGGRGAIYAWLRVHHDEIEALRAVHLNLWTELAPDMLEDGVAEAREGRSLRNRIWKTWQRVQRDVEAAAAAKPKKIYPSRLPVTWRPQLADVQPVTSSPSHISAAVAVGVVMDTPEAQAKIDRVFAELAERDKKKSGIFGDG